MIEDTSEFAGVIYGLHNGDHNYRYIGQTTMLISKRLNGHRYEARRGINRPLYRWMRKYGPENIYIDAIETFTDEDIHMIDEREIFLIAQYREFEEVWGENLNISIGGSVPSRGAVRSAETRARMSAATKGRKLSDERKAQMSEHMKGNKYRVGTTLSPEHKKALHDSRRGVARTDAEKAVISAAQKGRKFTEEHMAKLRESRSKSTTFGTGNHNRWHRDRGIIKDDCRFCTTVPAS